MIPLSIPDAARSVSEMVKNVGVVATAFLILLGFVMFLQYRFNTNVESSLSFQISKLGEIERKIDGVVNNAADEARMQQYFMRQICYNTADTESERNACNPPPHSLSSE